MDTRISPRRRYGVLLVLLAWLTPLLVCPGIPGITVGFNGLTHGAPDRTIQALTGQQTHGDVDNDICCTAQQHLSAVAQTYDLKVRTLSAFQAEPPAITAFAVATFAVKASEQWFVHRPPLIPWRSPALGAFWPHAPPV